jgi:hypothetical protein
MQLNRSTKIAYRHPAPPNSQRNESNNVGQLIIHASRRIEKREFFRTLSPPPPPWSSDVFAALRTVGVSHVLGSIGAHTLAPKTHDGSRARVRSAPIASNAVRLKLLMTTMIMLLLFVCFVCCCGFVSKTGVNLSLSLSLKSISNALYRRSS